MSRQIQCTCIMSHLCTCSNFIVCDWIVILLLPTGDAATGCSRYEAGVRWACRTAARIVLLSVHADHILYVHTPHPHHPGSKSQKERPWSISSMHEGRQEGCSSRVHKAARTVGICQRKRSQCVRHQHSHRITGHRVHTVADTDSITCVDKLIVSNYVWQYQLHVISVHAYLINTGMYYVVRMYTHWVILFRAILQATDHVFQLETTAIYR